jgi:hypothetical protein
MVSNPYGKAVERSERLDANLDVSLIDRSLQVFDFGSVIRFVDVDVPGPRSAIGAIAPAIAAPLQLVLQLERRLLGSDPDRLAAGPFQQNRKHGAVELGQGDREDFE